MSKCTAAWITICVGVVPLCAEGAITKGKRSFPSSLCPWCSLWFSSPVFRPYYKR